MEKDLNKLVESCKDKNTLAELLAIESYIYAKANVAVLFLVEKCGFGFEGLSNRDRYALFEWARKCYLKDSVKDDFNDGTELLVIKNASDRLYKRLCDGNYDFNV